MKPLAGKAALITGASRGIGAATAARLAADGAAVAITYATSPDRAAQVVADIKARGGHAVALQADSADAAAVAASVTAAHRALGRLDILINNAGIGGFRPLAEVSDAELDRLLAVNTRAVVIAAREACRLMPDQGRIISIGSTLAHRTFPGSSIYAMSKAALAGFSRALARELGPRGITVNVVDPGPVDTELNPADGPGGDMQRSLLAIPRFGRPEEIAALIAHLAGPEAGFITGATILADGGFAA